MMKQGMFKKVEGNCLYCKGLVFCPFCRGTGKLDPERMLSGKELLPVMCPKCEYVTKFKWENRPVTVTCENCKQRMVLTVFPYHG
jgi:hypothetical protein